MKLSTKGKEPGALVLYGRDGHGKQCVLMAEITQNWLPVNKEDVGAGVPTSLEAAEFSMAGWGYHIPPIASGG